MTVTARSQGAAFEELRDTLAGFHIKGLEQSFARSATRYLRDHARDLLPTHAPEALTEAERSALCKVGVDPDAPADDLSPIHDAAAGYAMLVATAVPLGQAAERLGVNPSRLRQRLAEGALLGIRLADGRSWGILSFQLTQQGELPGLRTVLRAMRRDIRPLEAEGFFRTPQDDLEMPEGEAMTPLAWLAAGRDPALVAELARAL